MRIFKTFLLLLTVAFSVLKMAARYHEPERQNRAATEQHRLQQVRKKHNAELRRTVTADPDSSLEADPLEAVSLEPDSLEPDSLARFRIRVERQVEELIMERGHDGPVAKAAAKQFSRSIDEEKLVTLQKLDAESGGRLKVGAVESPDGELVLQVTVESN